MWGVKMTAAEKSTNYANLPPLQKASRNPEMAAHATKGVHDHPVSDALRARLGLGEADVA